MSENIRKSVLIEAKSEFDEIKKFMEIEASKKIPGLVQEKLEQIFDKTLNEEMTINIDDNGKVEIQQDGDKNPNVEKVLNGGEEPKASAVDEDQTIVVSDEEDPITIEKNIDEMQNMEQEAKMNEAQPAAEAAPTSAATAAPEMPVATDAAPAAAPTADANSTETATKAEVDELKAMIAQLMVAQGLTPPAEAAPAATAQAPAPAGAEGEVPVIDDEATAQANAGAPVTEEIEVEGMQFETVAPMEENEIEIIDSEDDNQDCNVNEVGRSLGHSAKRSTDRNLFLKKMQAEKGHHAPVTAIVNENKKSVTEDVTKIKAQYEAKIAGLVKENASLKKSVIEANSELKEFGSGFATLKENFHKMQTFNAKMVLANKLLMEGGYSKEEKLNIFGQFDKATTIEEANKIYKSIIKEGKVASIAGISGLDKIRQNSPKAAKPTEKQTLFESAEVKRQKQLAGIRD